MSQRFIHLTNVNIAFQVVPRNGILIVFDVKNEFWIYVHDRGEEYYLHYDFWPTVPFIHRSVIDEYFSDIVVRKELEIHQENCKEETYDYFGKYINYLYFIHQKLPKFIHN